MRIATFDYNGEVSFGFLFGDSIIDRRTLGVSASNVAHFIASGQEIGEAELAEVPDRIELADVTLLPPVTPSKILCAGVNFRTHREETGNDPERPPHPVIFSRFADSHVGHGQALRHPGETDRFDYEGELVVVMKKRAWHVAAKDALDFVFGYSIYNDGSVRDWQRHSPQWIPGKNFFQSGAFGPWITTKDEVADLDNCRLITKVNGDIRQSALIGDMIFSIGELIEYVTTFTPLDAGDIIVAGTPGGVGAFMEPPGFVTDGDVVEILIDNLGLLRNPVRLAT